MMVNPKWAADQIASLEAMLSKERLSCAVATKLAEDAEAKLEEAMAQILAQGVLRRRAEANARECEALKSLSERRATDAAAHAAALREVLAWYAKEETYTQNDCTDERCVEGECAPLCTTPRTDADQDRGERARAAISSAPASCGDRFRALIESATHAEQLYSELAEREGSQADRDAAKALEGAIDALEKKEKDRQ